MHTAIDIYYADKSFGSNQSFLKDLPPELAIWLCTFTCMMYLEWFGKMNLATSSIAYFLSQIGFFKYEYIHELN